MRSWKACSCRRLGRRGCNGILGAVSAGSQALRLPVGRLVSAEALLPHLLVQGFLCVSHLPDRTEPISRTQRTRLPENQNTFFPSPHPNLAVDSHVECCGFTPWPLLACGIISQDLEDALCGLQQKWGKILKAKGSSGRMLVLIAREIFTPGMRREPRLISLHSDFLENKSALRSEHIA